MPSSLGLSTDELRLRKSKQDRERYGTNRESVRAALYAAEAANPELREERRRKQAELNSKSLAQRSVDEAANPELGEERQRKKAEYDRKQYAKQGAAETANPEMRVARLEKRNLEKRNPEQDKANKAEWYKKQQGANHRQEVRIQRSTQEGNECIEKKQEEDRRRIRIDTATEVPTPPLLERERNEKIRENARFARLYSTRSCKISRDQPSRCQS